MHIILALLGALAAAGYYWFIIRRAGDAASEVVEAAGRARGAYRRRKFRNKANESPLTAIDDPRTAAIVMAVAVATGQTALTDPQIAELHRVMRDILRVDNPEEELIFAQWVAREVSDPNNISLRLSKLWNGALNLDERRQLVEMVRDVAAAGGTLNHLQVEAIDRLRSRLVVNP